MKVTYLGTTVLLFDDGKDQILFDCHFTRPSLLKSFMGKLDIDVKVNEQVLKDFPMDSLKAIFISHTHHDHVLDMPYIAKKTSCNIYGSFSCMNVGRGHQIDESKLYCYDEKMDYEIGDFKIKVISSIHSIAHWYNDDLGQVIDKPLSYPAKKKAFKEGNSYDFIIHHQDKTYIIRPSYNYLEHQLDDYTCDYLFLGVGSMSKDSKERKEKFYKETIENVKPQKVIPLHWDNFFIPLYDKPKTSMLIMDNKQALDEVKAYCENHQIEFILQMPRTTIEL